MTMEDDRDKEKAPDELLSEKAKKDGNTCIGLGVGVGALGTAAALAAGATCPLCVVVAPALVGVGVYQRRKAKKLLNCSKDNYSRG